LIEAKPLVFHQELEDGTFMALSQGAELVLGKFDVNEGLERKIQIHNPNKEPALIAHLEELHTANSNSSFHSENQIGPGETITATIKVLSTDVVTLDNLREDNMTTHDRLEGEVEFSKI